MAKVNYKRQAGKLLGWRIIRNRTAAKAAAAAVMEWADGQDNLTRRDMRNAARRELAKSLPVKGEPQFWMTLLGILLQLLWMWWKNKKGL